MLAALTGALALDGLTWALAGSTLAIGLLGAWHCTVMCAAPCAWLCSSPSPTSARRVPSGWWRFMLARLLSYAAAGAVVAMAASGLANWAAQAATLKPLWSLVQMAIVAMGLYLLVMGRVPGVAASGLSATVSGPAAPAGGAPVWAPVRWARGPVPGPARAAPTARRHAWLAGLGWAAVPCGLLQAALVVAALAPSAAAGAVVMAAFAAGTSVGLLPAAAWARAGAAGKREPVAYRLAGGVLVLAAGLSLVLSKLLPSSSALCGV